MPKEFKDGGIFANGDKVENPYEGCDLPEARHEDFGKRERVAFGVFDTIINMMGRPPVPGFEDMSHIKQSGKLFCDEKGWPGWMPGDNTAQVQRLVLEAFASNVESLRVLRTDLRLEFFVGEKSYPLLPPFLDKIGADGVARYDYFVDARHQDPDFLAYVEDLKKKAGGGDVRAKDVLAPWYVEKLENRAAAGDQEAARELADPHGLKRSANPVSICARQGFWARYDAVTERCLRVLRHPETMARVWIVGEQTRDVQ